MKDEGFLSKLKKLLKDRHFYLVLLVLVVLTAVVVRLYILQIVEGETHEDEATVNSLVAVKIEMIVSGVQGKFIFVLRT